LIRSMVWTEVPPYFCTNNPIASPFSILDFGLPIFDQGIKF